MTFSEFKDSTNNNAPPTGISDLLLALWYDARENWDKAHTIAQDISSTGGSPLYAYLHRVEGDVWNAGYWYNMAHTTSFKGPLEEEWESLVKRFLSNKY